MKFKNWANKKTAKMDYLDIGLIKWSCIFFGILLVILIPALSEINPWWLVIIFLALAIRPAYRVYFK